MVSPAVDRLGAQSLSQPLLEVADVTLTFGGLHALSGVSVEFEEGTINAIIGPNGAGKTTLLNVISGFYLPQQGQIRFQGRDILSMPPSARATLGIARTFQNISLYRGMSVLENIKLGAHTTLRTNVLAGGFFSRATRRQEAALTQRIKEEIAPPLRLNEYLDDPVEGLAYGIQKRIELARALALSPKLLLLDEPVAGMNSSETEEMAKLIQRVRAEWDVTIIMIEHDMSLVMGISDRVAVLSLGQTVCEGTPAQVQTHPKAIEAYLGVDDDAVTEVHA